MTQRVHLSFVLFRGRFGKSLFFLLKIRTYFSSDPLDVERCPMTARQPDRHVWIVEEEKGWREISFLLYNVCLFPLLTEEEDGPRKCVIMKEGVE